MTPDKRILVAESSPRQRFPKNQGSPMENVWDLASVRVGPVLIATPVAIWSGFRLS
jgi:hypothetical protein